MVRSTICQTPTRDRRTWLVNGINKRAAHGTPVRCLVKEHCHATLVKNHLRCTSHKPDQNQEERVERGEGKDSAFNSWPFS